MDTGSLYTAVILAGGKNTRFSGRDKAFAPVMGVPMIGGIINILSDLFDRILVVTNSPERYSGFSNIELTRDTHMDAGPLGGIHAAMQAAPTPLIFVVSCDMPDLDKRLIEAQVKFFSTLKDADSLIPSVNSMIEPLHAIYRTGLAGKLDKFLTRTTDRSIRAFLAQIRTVYQELPAERDVLKAFRNINRPEDLENHAG